MPFDPFRRFRLRSHPVSALPSPTEEDTDDASPERSRPHVVHVPAHRNGRGSVSEDEKPSRSTTDRLAPSTHIALALDKTSHQPHPERPPKRASKPGVASVSRSTDSLVALQPTPKSTLVCCIASKFNISIPGSGVRSRPSMRTLSGDKGPPAQRPRPPGTTSAAPPPLPNSFVSKQHREAALRERGLLPPRKDLSEQEREADERIGSFPSPAILTVHGATEAERLKASWLAINRTSESSESERGPPPPSQLQETRTPPSSTPPDVGTLRRSSDGKTDQLPTGRPSCCSSVPPLSPASYLEVLHEEPSEQGSFLPSRSLSPAKVPIVSSPSNSPPSPTSPTLVESSVSCSVSSHCPGSTLESHSQSGHPLFHEKENLRSTSSLRRPSDRPRRVVGSSMSKFGTHSLTNLRRSVAGSLKSTVSSADLSSSSISQAQRAAIDPTMHSIGSILRAAGDIQDAECRRLSELAFLD